MRFIKKISNFMISQDCSVIEALAKIDENKHGIVFTYDEFQSINGACTDGDIRRYMIENTDADIYKLPLKNVSTKSFSYGLRSEPKSVISEKLTKRVKVLPIVTSKKKVVKVAVNEDPVISIGAANIGTDYPAFIIAEIGNNHQGKLELAKKLVDDAKNAGADCAKFQMRTMQALYRNKSNTVQNDLGAEYTLDLLQRFQLTDEELFEVFDYCKFRDIEPLCTPWDSESLNKLQEYGLNAYKIASADLTNHDLIKLCAETDKPLIISTGMSTLEEIGETVDLLDSLQAEYVLLHCNSTYPAPFKDINLNFMPRLGRWACNFGYSGHERGIEVPVAAVALGASVIEKHLTYDKSAEGTDHKVSLLANEFANMVSSIRNVETAMSQNTEQRSLTQGEMLNRHNLAKSIFASREIKKGEIITRNDLEIRSPGIGVQPNKLGAIIGFPAIRDKKKADAFFDSDLKSSEVHKKTFEFAQPFGIPVRYKDYHELVEGTNLKFVEFHLSYSDLKLQPTDFIHGTQPIGFAVHAPELFGNDHLLDLANKDKSYRSVSIEHLQRIVDVTVELQELFPSEHSPNIIINVGGWDRENFWIADRKVQGYDLVRESLDQINFYHCVPCIQTMPPFPWHFGGQSHHNLFVLPEEIYTFCSKTSYRLCFDVSHSMMASKYYGFSFYEGLKILAPYISHLHIVDSLGVDGEGVEIGKGDVDFVELMTIINQDLQNIKFIPEIWQGHLNDGSGFWKALSFLENI